MKTYKNAAILLLSALFAMCGCQSVEPYETIPEDKAQPETQAEAKVFTATIESEEVPATKTVMDAAGNVLWSRGDKASVFAASTLNALYQVTDESAGQSSGMSMGLIIGIAAGAVLLVGGAAAGIIVASKKKKKEE